VNTTLNHDEQVLNQSLQSLVATHGYSKVMDHLARFQQNLSHQAEEVDPRYLMTLSPEEREPHLKASVDRALPAYEADRALPEAERQLTADLETGDFYDYPKKASTTAPIAEEG